MGDRAVSLALLLFSVIGCGACSSVPVLHFSDEAGAGGGDGGPCVPSGAEVCDDGIDNDCNGQVDCADDACSPHYVCVDTGAADWTHVAVAAAARPACPSGFGAATDLTIVAGAAGAPTCGCDCGGPAGCAPAGVIAAFGNGAACNNGNTTFGVRAACEKMAGNGVAVAANAFVRATAGTAAACNATAPGTFPPVQNGRSCAVPKLGAGCATSQVCVPRPGAAFDSCVTKAGTAMCPGAFPNELHSGTVTSDTRACAACSCTSSPCTGSVKLWDDKACTNGASLTVDASAPPGTCARVKNAAFQARSYTSTVTGGCVMGAAGAGSGALTLSDDATICCR